MEKSEAPATPDLEAPDLPAKQSSVAQRWKQNLSPTHADLVCLLLTFLTGLCDSSAYNAWSCFLGMQTGTSHTRRSPAKGGGATPKKKQPTNIPRETQKTNNSSSKQQETPSSSVSAPQINPTTSHGAGSSPSSRSRHSSSAQ